MVDLMSKLMGEWSQTCSGAQPSMFGSAMKNSKTAAVYAQARDQAMGSLAIAYAPLKRWVAEITFLAVQLSEDRDGDSSNGIIPDAMGGFRQISVDLGKLRAGRYVCYAEGDDTVPESESSQKAAFMQMVTTMGPNPEFQKLLMQPQNQYLFKRFSGVKAFAVPGDQARTRQLQEIKQLLDGDPIPPTPEEKVKVAVGHTISHAGGQPVGNVDPEQMLRSSVEIDEVYDNHQAHFDTVTWWMNSEDGYKAKKLNPQGWENVRLHGIAHQAALKGTKPTLQDNMPDPRQAIQGAQAQTAIAEHAQASQPPPGNTSPTLGV
jgi:hypothetical protein